MSDDIDRQVAERIMRFILYPGHFIGQIIPEDETESGFPETVLVDVPAYSTDIAAAWQVVEAMRARGYHFEIDAVSTRVWEMISAAKPSELVYPVQWIATLKSDKTKRSRYKMGRGDTAPLAICRAALAAVTSE